MMQWLLHQIHKVYEERLVSCSERVHEFLFMVLCYAVRGGGKILLKGLYSGLAGNLAGVLP